MLIDGPQENVYVIRLLVVTQCSQGLWQVIFTCNIQQSHQFLGLRHTKMTFESLMSIPMVLSSFKVSVVGQFLSLSGGMLVFHVCAQLGKGALKQ